jgi:transcriptional regulator with XRE-family HTH domain
MDNLAATTYPASRMAVERGPAARTDPAFRAWLRQLRERAGLTQDQLAAAVGTDRRNIRRWEVEGHDPAGSVLLRILDAVGVELVPKRPSELPRAVNAELRDLQMLLSDLEERSAQRHDEVVALLGDAPGTGARRGVRRASHR